MPPDSASETAPREAVFFLAYFSVYLLYLFFTLEGELLHWLTLVLLPFALIRLYQTRFELRARTLDKSLATVGLAKGNLMTGVGLAAIIGLGLSLLQTLVSRQRDDIWALLLSGKALVAYPLVLALMLATAAFTEEFFFRGVLQTRLSHLFKSNVAAVVVSAGLFGIYHLPYAYLNPNWPSQGDWGAAWAAAMSQGGIMGLILGVVYLRSRNNLLAAVVLHALVNSLPAMAQLAG